ncbi:MAG: EAL domain-containing protein [Treponema sp.]
MEITVEGVETEHQYDRLREFGCDYIQGYFFSRPITGAEIEKSVFK